MPTSKKGHLTAVIDKRCIKEVCIDDFALKKRRSYGTVMVDVSSHRIIDMIDSREYDDVKKWLKSYPNLQIVSRDGSITYHNAITDAHPNALQVSDRFHILKNLTDYGRDYLKKELRQKIAIPATDEAVEQFPFPATQADENRTLTLKEKYDQMQKLTALGYTKTRICENLNMDVRVYEKLLSSSPDELNKQFDSRRMINHEEKVQRKMALANEVRELKHSGISKREISRRTGLALQTINKYLDVNFTPVHAAYGKNKAGTLTPYMAEIDRMAAQGIMTTVILQRIQEKGYSGSDSNLRHYVSDWKKRRKQCYNQENAVYEQKQFLDRKHVFQLLYHPASEVTSY